MLPDLKDQILISKCLIKCSSSSINSRRKYSLEGEAVDGGTGLRHCSSAEEEECRCISDESTSMKSRRGFILGIIDVIRRG